MGNTPMTIALKVDHGNNRGTMAGSILYGRIYLNNQQSVNAHSIRLKMVGIEDAVVHHTSQENLSSSNDHNRNGSSATETWDHYERHSDKFFSIDHTIKEFPGGVIPRGQYEFPFALQLPKSLPSSMKAKNYQSHCEVRYEVIAEIFQKPNSLFYTNPHAKEKLTVVAMPSTVSPHHDSSLHLPVDIIPISNCACCCFGSCTKIGLMALETKLDKTTLFLDSPSSPSTSHCNINKRSGQQPYNSQMEGNDANHQYQSIGIKFRCTNKSKERVKNVKSQLVETIEWCVNGHTAQVKTTLVTTTRDASLYPELKPTWHKPFAWEERQFVRDSTSPLLQEKPWRTIDPPLTVGGTMATDTYRGTAVNVRHVLSLNIITEGCCSTNPDASALVEIYRNPLAFGGSEANCDDPFVGKQSQPQQDFQTPSAPFEDEFFDHPSTPSHATAPSSIYDDSTTSEVPMALAQLVLPEDWNAQEEEIVTIPIVEATAVGTTAYAGGGYSK